MYRVPSTIMMGSWTIAIYDFATGTAGRFSSMAVEAAAFALRPAKLVTMSMATAQTKTSQRHSSGQLSGRWPQRMCAARSMVQTPWSEKLALRKLAAYLPAPPRELSPFLPRFLLPKNRVPVFLVRRGHRLLAFSPAVIGSRRAGRLAVG
jgi:hypothetical protein